MEVTLMDTKNDHPHLKASEIKGEIRFKIEGGR